MSSWPQRLDLFGVIHVDRIGKVTRELGPMVQDVDAVCIESPQPPSLETYVKATLRAPLCTITEWIVFTMIYAPLYILFNRDLWPTELAAMDRLVAAQEPSPDLHHIDTPMAAYFARAPLPVLLANWLVFAGLLYLVPVGLGIAISVAVVGGIVPALFRRAHRRYLGIIGALLGTGVWWALVWTQHIPAVIVYVVVLTFLLILVLGFSERNQDMIGDVAQLSTDNGYDSVLVITGKGHLSGFVDLARERGISVGTVHVSKWFRAGGSRESFEEAVPDSSTALTLSEAERAPRWRRGLAGTVDIAVAIVVWVGVLILLWALFELVYTTATPIYSLLVFFAFFLSLVLVRALLACHAGGTIGNRLVGIELVHQTGTSVDLRTATVRYAYWFGDLLTLFLAAIFDDNHRLLCDHVAGTHVVAGNAAAPSTTCPGCDLHIEREWTYCRDCGTKLE